MKSLKAFTLFLLAMGLFAHTSIAQAAATLPSTAIWYEPSDVAAGTSITLHALVYNNTTTSATVTVEFSTPQGKIADVTEVVASQAAKTLSVVWKMPAISTVVTGTVTTALASNNTSVSSLVGTLGTITIAPLTTATPLSTISFPGSTQLSAWFGPLIAKIENYRLNEVGYFTQLQATTNAKIKAAQNSAATTTPTTTPASNALNNVFSSPSNGLVYSYATAMLTIFSSVVIFYIVLILIVLLLLRFIVNLLF